MNLLVFSENFVLSEMEFSYTAVRNELDNFLPARYWDNTNRLVQEILQPLRTQSGEAVTVTSGYRSKRVNAAVKGAKNSAHLSGRAADIKSVRFSKPTELAQFVIDSDIKFDKLIVEFDSWVHIQVNKYPGVYRRAVYRAVKNGDETEYLEGLS